MNKKVRKGLSVFTAVTTTLWLIGASFLVAPAYAVVPGDYGLTEGDVISAWDQAGDPDVYIVNDWGYKRLFLNPAIFGFYGHLGFDKVTQTSPTTRDAFGTSGLFRNCEIGDEKVYGVATTGEDTGQLHWVNMSGSQAVAEDADFFLKVFCINNNEFNWYTSNGTSFGSDYTSLSQVPDYTREEVPAGNITASLSPLNLGARTLTNNAVGVNVLVVRLTGTGTIDQLVVTRTGAGQVDDWGSIYVYDGVTRLTSGRSLNSSTGQASFNLDLDVNGTKDLTIVADESESNAGNVHIFEVSEASDITVLNGTAGGSYPIRGSVLGFSATAGGTVVVTKTGSISNPKVGAVKAEITQFKLATAVEAGTVKRMRMINNGTIADGNITNVVIETLTGVHAGTGAMNGDGYLDLTFNDFLIPKGENETFQIYAKIGGKRGETIQLYLEVEDTDTLVMGSQFGLGMNVTDDTLDASGDAHELTLQGGDLTLTFTGPNATNVGTDTEDTHFIDFTITAGRDIELKKHRITLCSDLNGDGTYDNLTSATNYYNDLEDIKIINVDTGAVLVGAVDGLLFVDASASATECGGTGGLYHQFTDAFDIKAGETLNLALTADVTTANTSETNAQLVDGSVIKIVLESYADLAGVDGNTTVAKYTDTNKAVLAAQIVPSADLASNTFTVSTTGLTIGLAGTPASTTFVKGTLGVPVVGFTMRASLASPVTVKKVTLDGRSGTADASLSVTHTSSVIDVLELYDGDTGARINATIISNTLSSDGKMQFDNMGWTIPAGETKTLLVKANLSTNAVPDANDTFSFDIEATTDVTALDNSNQAVTVTGSDLNGAADAGVAITVSSGGAMTVALAPSSPSTKAIYWGQQGAETSRFRFTSSNEAFHIEKFTIGASGAIDSGNERTDMAANVKSFTVEYTNKAGTTLTQTQSISSGASANFGFSGTNRPYVPKDSSLDIVVKANMKTKAEGATSTETRTAGIVFGVYYLTSYDGSVANGFRAVGEGSGTILNGDSTNVGRTVDSNDMYVYRVFPKVDGVTIIGGEPLGVKDVFKFTITAMGLSDSNLYFNGGSGLDDGADEAWNVSSGSINFSVEASGSQGAAGVTLIATTYDMSDGSIVDVSNITTTGGVLTDMASLSVDFTSKDVEIAGGQSKTFRIELGFSNGFLDQSDYFQLRLLDDQAGLINWVDNSTGSTADADVGSKEGVLRNLPLNGPSFSKL